MDRSLRKTADAIVRAGIEAVLPDAAVARALERFDPGGGRVVLVAAGKAAWQMARAALDCLGHVDAGIVITKYGHVRGELPGVVCCEAGHPVPDQAGFDATRRALALVQGLAARDRVLFLLSGGGSALLEQPLLPAGQLQDITRQLLACGADIVEINTIRKRLSAVKGGRFALACAPARVFSVVLSDILGDPLDMIASGPACPDRSTCAEAAAIAAKYALRLSPQARALLARETPKALDNVATCITGSVRQLCRAAASACEARGYQPVLLTDCLSCEAREAGRFLGAMARTHAGQGRRLAFLAGGETVVHLTGHGLGGRNHSAWGRTAPTAPPTPPAAMRTAPPWRRWPRRAGRWTPPSGTTTHTTPYRRWTACSTPAPPAPTSTTSPPSSSTGKTQTPAPFARAGALWVRDRGGR